MMLFLVYEFHVIWSTNDSRFNKEKQHEKVSKILFSSLLWPLLYMLTETRFLLLSDLVLLNFKHNPVT